MLRKILSRWLVIPVVALGLAVSAGVGNAQFGPYQTICFGVAVPPGWHIVGAPFYSILCSGPSSRPNAYMIAPN